jgi:predicted metal-dependent HD superfamily phosphohydrolase
MSRLMDNGQSFLKAYEEDARLTVERLLEKLPPDLLYHGPPHTLEYVYPEAMAIGRLEEGVDHEGLLILAVIALFHDTGFLYQYVANEPIAADLARTYASESNSTTLRGAAQSIYEAILNTDMQSPPKNLLERMIRDADLSILGMPEFMASSQQLREEILLHPEAKMYATAHSDHDWATSQLKFLESHHWFTATAMRLYGDQKEENIRLFKQRYFQFLT